VHSRPKRVQRLQGVELSRIRLPLVPLVPVEERSSSWVADCSHLVLRFLHESLHIIVSFSSLPCDLISGNKGGSGGLFTKLDGVICVVRGIYD